jgi:hypothetical protein
MEKPCILMRYDDLPAGNLLELTKPTATTHFVSSIVTGLLARPSVYFMSSIGGFIAGASPHFVSSIVSGLLARPSIYFMSSIVRFIAGASPQFVPSAVTGLLARPSIEYSLKHNSYYKYSLL